MIEQQEQKLRTESNTEEDNSSSSEDTSDSSDSSDANQPFYFTK